MIKYLALDILWNAEIKAVEVASETAKQVTLPSGRKANKRSSYENYFDTWAEAHAFLMSIAEQNVRNCRTALEHANSFLGNVKGLKGQQ